MTDIPDVEVSATPTLDIINKCLNGKHGPADQDNNCMYCGVNLPPPDEYHMALVPLPETATPPVGMTKTVICADGPLAGMTLFSVPLGATVICEIYTSPAEEPYFGTFYKPYEPMEAFYRCNGGKAYLMFTRPA